MQTNPKSMQETHLKQEVEKNISKFKGALRSSQDMNRLIEGTGFHVIWLCLVVHNREPDLAIKSKYTTLYIFIYIQLLSWVIDDHG